MHALTRDPKWADLYQKSGGRTRPAGTPAMEPPGSLRQRHAIPWNQPPVLDWFARRRLPARPLGNGKRPANICAPTPKGLAASLNLAAGGLSLAAGFDNDATAPCLLNWRTLNLWWQPQHSEAEAVAVAERQAKELGRLSPRRGPEFNLVRESLFAAWIVTLCPDRTLVEPHRSAILAAINHFDYKRLYYSQFFPAESAAYRLQLLEKD